MHTPSILDSLISPMCCKPPVILVLKLSENLDTLRCNSLAYLIKQDHKANTVRLPLLFFLCYQCYCSQKVQYYKTGMWNSNTWSRRCSVGSSWEAGIERRSRQEIHLNHSVGNIQTPQEPTRVLKVTLKTIIKTIITGNVIWLSFAMLYYTLNLYKAQCQLKCFCDVLQKHYKMSMLRSIFVFMSF